VKKLFLCLVLLNSIYAHQKFTIVGSGPAGITVIGMLLDLCIPAQDITWIDKEFNVGDLSKYPNIPANTKNKLFIDFINACKTFREIEDESIKQLYNYDFEKEYPLETIIKPLKIITDNLRLKINSIQGKLENLYFDNDNWNLAVNDQLVVSSHVILAIGSHPRKMNFDNYNDLKEISLVDALDKSKLETIITAKDTVAVIGSAHSAILILKHLSELNVDKIINFYKGPLKYTEDMGSWLLNISSGLKGITAEWAKNVLEKNPPQNLSRIESNEINLVKYLPSCTKVIQAWGFEKNSLNSSVSLNYNDVTGVIAPRLFGIGIAFPEKYVDQLGNVEHRVGINSFMEYAQRMVPEWVKLKSCNRRENFKAFDKLFNIELL